uniref:Uncharacterized protein n=1 Tax=Catharus ustulatus TaxID=91951 RepID=A0A8C3U6U5_CATUS
MKILYLLFAVFLLLFQATSGSADPLFADTVECRSQGKFCRAGACPPTFAATGTLTKLPASLNNPPVSLNNQQNLRGACRAALGGEVQREKERV